MKKLLSATAFLLVALAIAGCGLIPTDPAAPSTGPLRYLTFKYVEIPASMNNETVIRQIHDTRYAYIRNNALQHTFPINDSALMPGYMMAHNRAVLTNPGTQRGRAEIFGGQDPGAHPFQSGVPSSLYLSVLDGNGTNVTHSEGDWRIEFNGGEIAATQMGNSDDFLEFVLESYDLTTSHATGRFALIARGVEDPTRRWAIFDGEFSLTRGRN